MRDASTTKTVCLAALLTTAAMTVWVIGFAFVASITEEVFGLGGQRDNSYQQFLFRDDGEPVWKSTDYSKGYDWAEYHDLDGQPVTMTPKDEHPRMMTLIDSRLWKRPKRATWSTRVTAVTSLARTNAGDTGIWYLRDFGERGLFVAYDKRTHRECGYFGLRGFSLEKPPSSDWFPTLVNGERREIVEPFSYRHMWFGFPYMQQDQTDGRPTSSISLLYVEPGGRRVHAIDFVQKSIRLIHEGDPVLAANFVRAWKRDTATRAVLRTSDTLRLVELTNEGVVGTEVIPLPENLRRSFGLQWVRGTVGDVLVTLKPGAWRLTSLDSEHKVIRERDVADPLAGKTRGNPMPMLVGLTAIQTPVLGDFFAWMAPQDDLFSRFIDTHRATELGLEWPNVRELSPSDFAIPIVLLHLTAIGWSVLAVRRLRKFSAARQEQWFWGGWMLLFGAPGYLAFRVHRSWGRFPTCPPQPVGEVFNKTLVGQVENLPHGRRSVLAAYTRLLDAGEHFGAGFAARVGFPASHTALALKEFRLTAGIALLACLSYLVMVARMAGIKGFGIVSDFVSITTAVPFVHDGFNEPFVVVGVLLAVWLAVWQSAAEARGEAWLFLLHRPVSRRAVVMSKLLVGLLVVTGCSALPILLYATWASRPGSVAAPFEWSMTEIAWREWAALTPIYLGTLLTLLRPARWFGTRLLPVIAAFGWLAVRSTFETWLWPASWEFFGVFLIDICLICCLLLTVREREYP